MVKPTTELSDSPKFFDIAPPGKIAPSATTRPVIVGNKPQQVDRMVNAAVEPAPAAKLPETSTEFAPPEPAPQPVSEQPAAPQVVTHHARKVRTARWLWLVPAVILIIIILDLLQHYGKL
jgi:hypothetical protein